MLLRREQYRRADDASQATDLARSFVIGKIANCRSVLMRALRDHPKAKGHKEVRSAVNELATILARLGTAPSLDVLRGMEGRRRPHLFWRVRSSDPTKQERVWIQGPQSSPAP